MREAALIAWAVAVAMTLLGAGIAVAMDCPPNDPGARDCSRAASTARHPMVPIGGAVVGGLLGLIAQRAIGGIISAAPSPPLEEDWVKDWDLTADDAFCNLGKRLRSRAGFQHAGTPREQARYALERTREVAGRFGLRTGSGSQTDDLLVGYYRGANGPVLKAMSAGALVGAVAGGGLTKSLAGAGVGLVLGAIGAWALLPSRRFDPEGAAPLKCGRIGNCGDWSIAFKAVLRCAGVDNAMIVAADNDPTRKFSERFTGTDTSVMLYQGPEDPASWRFFDLFMSLHRRPPQASSSSALSSDDWADLPVDQWLRKFQSKKQYVKDLNGKVLYPPSAPPTQRR
jgi:hypothetical protein